MSIGPVVQLGRLYTTNNNAGKIGSGRRESSFGNNCARSSNSISAGGTCVGTSGSEAKPEEDAVQWAGEGVGPWREEWVLEEIGWGGKQGGSLLG